MDYKKAYQETVEQLFIVQSQLVKEDNEKELSYRILCAQSSVIGEIWNNLDKVSGERKEKAEAMMQKLILVFNHMGMIYLNELIARKRNFELNSALIEASKKIELLEKQIETLNQIDKL